MVFTQIEFFIFFVVVLGLAVLIKNHTQKKCMFLFASYFFYGYWDWRFLGLLFFSTVIDFSIGKILKTVRDPGKRKFWIIVSICVNLGVLGFFKYFNFFIDSFNALVEPLGLGPRLTTLSIILPVGISFYTFQSLSYTIDVYRGRLKVCDSFLDFALFVAFFPQLVAGPIVRAEDLLPQFETPPKMSWERTFSGFKQITFGFLKKALIADRLAVFVDGAFDNPGLLSGPSTWLAVVAYAVQIYCDFSGYSDIAIGTARILGYDFVKNFDHPYIAETITDFWRRWHMSLSTWLKDYLYIPLGGNRLGRVRTYINLILTMLLGGLWHGADWKFVIWGAIHGLALAAHKIASPYLKIFSSHKSHTLQGVHRLSSWMLTMVIVCVAWVFFRARSVRDAALIIRQMFAPISQIDWFPPFAIGAILFIAITHAVHKTTLPKRFELTPYKFYTPAILFFIVWITLIFRARDFKPFIYFQF